MIVRGQRRGRLTALRRIPRRWVCRCDCGECAAFTAASLKHARQCPVCTARDTLHARTANLLTPEEQQMLFSLSISPAGAYLFTPQGGAGPAPPAWLPQAPSGDRPVIYADFANGHYWGNGAVTTAAALFTQDLNWGPFDPATIVAGLGLGADGAGADNARPTIAASFYAGLLATGCTYVQTTNTPNASDYNFNTLIELYDAPAFNNEYIVAVTGITVNVTDPAANISQITPVATHVTTGATLTPAQIALSVNGGAVTTGASAAPGTPLTNIAMFCRWTGTQPTYLQSFALYAPQPNADLPTLSTP